MICGVMIGWGVAHVARAGSAAEAPHAPAPWLDTRRSPDARATLAVAAMTLDEKLSLLHGPMALPFAAVGRSIPELPPDAIPAAGYVPGVPRLGIPALKETDASLGVTNPRGLRPGDVATALPAGLALAATFDPALAYRAGALVGDEARAKGFNVLLGGGMNLARDPRNGRNFEYLGEDPLLAGTLAGEAVRGTQDHHVVSTVKHFALNANETNRTTLDARVDRSSLRESDLLAFELAIERGHPGAVMCAYNRVNGEYACGNRWLLQDVLKGAWRYPGWVMSDWGAVHDVRYANAGLDQESGEQLDAVDYFDAPLRAAVVEGSVPLARVDDMVHRIVRSMFEVGIDVPTPAAGNGTIDYPAHARLALEIEQKGIVLLKNDAALLPITRVPAHIAVIGGNARLGVLSGGGSAQVTPFKSRTAPGPGGVVDGQVYDPSAPYDALQAAAPASRFSFDDGAFPARAAALAARADLAVVFVTQPQTEGADVPDLALPSGQNETVTAVAAANPNTVVVLETGNPVSMPWLGGVKAVLAAWYPGQEGGQAIADVLFGIVNPSGHLPISFPAAETVLPRPALPNLRSEPGSDVSIDYTEGADVGYRGYRRRAAAPLFAFGHGLSYTRFAYSDVAVNGGRRLSVSFVVRNVGPRAGGDVPQAYLTAAAGRPMLRLIGFRRVELAPGESRTIRLEVDPRLVASFSGPNDEWQIDGGIYRVGIGASAVDLRVGGETVMARYRGPLPRHRIT